MIGRAQAGDVAMQVATTTVATAEVLMVDSFSPSLSQKCLSPVLGHASTTYAAT
jgi:hypothetical protein